MSWRTGWLAALAAGFLWGCAPQGPEPGEPSSTLTAASYKTMPGWAGDHVAEALPALLAQCRKLASMPPDMPLGGQGLSQLYGGTAGQWGAACAAVRGVAPDDRAVRTLIEAWFQPYEINAAGLVTGFYEPQARGAWQRGGVFQTPVLARPTDLVETPPSAADPNGRPVMGRLVANHLVPYWTRAEIEAGSAGARTHPVLWLADPIDLFFLQIQGSGRVVLPDAHVVRLAFAGSNGRAYTPIGKKLIERHVLAPDQVTMQSIRAWLDANPAEARMLMNQNDHYVFFRLDADAGVAPGPPGALGVNLVPGRSAAVDRHFTPLASLLFLDTTDPLTRAPWRHLVLAQDLGTDVIGPARVDLFMGAGDMAALRAGQMRQPGTAYLLLPRPPA